MKSIELKEVIKSNFTDFDGMHEEVNKCKFLTKFGSIKLLTTMLIVNCLQKASISHCVTVKELLIENPSFDNLNKIQVMFAQFANKTYDLQSKMHDRIDYLKELYNDKPTLCENTRRVNGIASVTQSIEISLPRVFDKIRKTYGETKRFKPTSYGILVEIPDYTDDIKYLSNRIMSGIKTNAQESMAKMGFVVQDLLGKQVSCYLKNFYEPKFRLICSKFKFVRTFIRVSMTDFPLALMPLVGNLRNKSNFFKMSISCTLLYNHERLILLYS